MICWRNSPAASSTKLKASTAASSTSPASRQGRLSGNETPAARKSIAHAFKRGLFCKKIINRQRASNITALLKDHVDFLVRTKHMVVIVFIGFPQRHIT